MRFFDRMSNGWTLGMTSPENHLGKQEFINFPIDVHPGTHFCNP